MQNRHNQQKEGFRHSFCHGWSAGVIPYLIEVVAGIKPQGTGMKRIVVDPNLSGLKNVKVKFPTCYGVLEVEHSLKDGKVHTSVKAPKEIKVEINKFKENATWELPINHRLGS